MNRYLFKAAGFSFSIGFESSNMEMWFGLESEEPIDLAAYSRETGDDLIPCEGMSEEEIASCNVREWLSV